jgi:hypothetical protein
MGLVSRFMVTIDAAKYNFGSFNIVKGLDVTWDVAEYRAGDAKNER